MNHLSQDLIFRKLDDEVTLAERVECEAHLAVCADCRNHLTELRQFSGEIEDAVNEAALPEMSDVRRQVRTAIEKVPALPRPAQVMRRFGWGMGIAATLAFGILLLPKYDNTLPVVPVSTGGVIEIDGETFVPVPFSNSDLSTFSPHIVQMQVPVSSLADVGIMVEPITNRVGAEPEQSVLADVLVGADGQPRGVHVLGSE